jgi:hypothetical protein
LEAQILPEGQVNTEFKSIVEQSKSKIAEATQLENKIEQKRGPGRPRKHPVSGSQVVSEAPAAPLESSSIDISQHLKAPLIGLSKIPAIKYEIPELAFDETEALACAESLNNVLTAFVPDASKMDPKTAAVLGAAVTFGSIGLTKFQIYSQKQQEKKLNEPKNTPTPEVTPLNQNFNPEMPFSRTSL